MADVSRPFAGGAPGAGRAVDMNYMPYWVARFTDHVDSSSLCVPV